jgi:hypothetical protein
MGYWAETKKMVYADYTRLRLRMKGVTGFTGYERYRWIYGTFIQELMEVDY